MWKGGDTVKNLILNILLFTLSYIYTLSPLEIKVVVIYKKKKKLEFFFNSFLLEDLSIIIIKFH